VAKAGNDLDAKLDALYAAPLAEFTAARNALAKSLDAAGREGPVALEAGPRPRAGGRGEAAPRGREEDRGGEKGG
jgi:hypothetical protein